MFNLVWVSLVTISILVVTSPPFGSPKHANVSAKEQFVQKKMQTSKCLSRFPVTDYCTFPRCQDLLNREWCFMLRHVAASMFFPLQRPNYIPETEHGNRKKRNFESNTTIFQMSSCRFHINSNLKKKQGKPG